jgi:hypothetical protein
LDTRDGFSAPVTGTPDVGALVAAVVGASVAALVPVDSTVIGGTFVLGILVDVCCPPQAVSINASTTIVDSNILNFLILMYSFPNTKFFSAVVRFAYPIRICNSKMRTMGKVRTTELGVSLTAWGNIL